MHQRSDISESMDLYAFIDDPRIKRVFDAFFAGCVLIVIFPLLALIALAILLVSRGAPIYSHQRVGLNGRAFGCLKFRTMIPNADEALKDLLERCPAAAREWATHRKLRNDPRILPVIGQFLRQTSLDELPQFFNVLMGDMSVVGPRPVVQDELERYGSRKSLYLSVRPGLTGPWQIGNRSNESYENRVNLDADYVSNRSMAIDLGIILSTARMFLRGRNPNAF